MEKVKRIVQAITQTQDNFKLHFKEAEQKVLPKLKVTSKMLQDMLGEERSRIDGINTI